MIPLWFGVDHRDDAEELRLWYEREVYALGTMAGGDESFDAGYFVGLRRAAHQRGLC